MIIDIIAWAAAFAAGWIMSRLNEERKFWKAMADVSKNAR